MIWTPRRRQRDGWYAPGCQEPDGPGEQEATTLGQAIRTHKESPRPFQEKVDTTPKKNGASHHAGETQRNNRYQSGPTGNCRHRRPQCCRSIERSSPPHRPRILNRRPGWAPVRPSYGWAAAVESAMGHFRLSLSLRQTALPEQKWYVSFFRSKSGFLFFLKPVHHHSLRVAAKQLRRSAIRPSSPCEGRALGIGVPKIHVQTIAMQCKRMSSGSTQLAPRVCLGARATTQARIRTAMHTEPVRRRNQKVAHAFVRTRRRRGSSARSKTQQ